MFMKNYRIVIWHFGLILMLNSQKNIVIVKALLEYVIMSLHLGKRYFNVKKLLQKKLLLKLTMMIKTVIKKNMNNKKCM